MERNVVKYGARKSLPVLVFCTETLVRSHVLTFASSAHAIIIVVNGINAKNAFLAKTKGRMERERERKRKGRKKGKGKLEVKLWQKRKNRKRPSRKSNLGPGTRDPRKRGWYSTIEPPTGDITIIVIVINIFYRLHPPAKQIMEAIPK